MARSPVAAFGKLPDRGDFLREGEHPLAAPFDDWLKALFADLGGSQEQPLKAFDALPPVAWFCRDPHAGLLWGNVTWSATDSVDRRYPFTASMSVALNAIGPQPGAWVLAFDRVFAQLLARSVEQWCERDILTDLRDMAALIDPNLGRSQLADLMQQPQGGWWQRRHGSAHHPRRQALLGHLSTVRNAPPQGARIGPVIDAEDVAVLAELTHAAGANGRPTSLLALHPDSEDMRAHSVLTWGPVAAATAVASLWPSAISDETSHALVAIHDQGTPAVSPALQATIGRPELTLRKLIEIVERDRSLGYAAN